MNLWTMLGVVVLIYGVIAVILVSNMRVDLKTPWKGLRGAQEQGKHCAVKVVERYITYFYILGGGADGPRNPYNY